MLVILVGENDNAAEPFLLGNELSDVSLSIAASLHTDDSGILLQSWSFGRQRRWRRVLEQELAETASHTVHAELGLLDLVAWSEEHDSAVLRDVVLGSEFLSDTADSLLEVGREELAVDEQRLFVQQVLEFSILRVQVADGVVSAVLSSVLSGEAEAV